MPNLASPNLHRFPLWIRWCALLTCSVLAAACLDAIHLPAALLLGPMAVGILFSVSGANMRISNPMFSIAQGVLGMMVANSLPLSAWSEVGQQWYILVAGTMATVISSGLLGYLLSRSSLLPGTTAIWGSAPGAASVMTLMSESYGADMRLVAVMQYLRVVFCVLGAALVASALGVTGIRSHEMEWWAPESWQGFAATLLLVLTCVTIGRYVRIPSGALLVTMMAGILVKSTGLMPIVLPHWLLAIAYATLGWGIGFRFTPTVLAHAARLMPYITLAVLALILANAGFALVLAYWADIDYLSAFLATSPGGADSVAIIAATTHSDLSFVMAMQITRFMVVLVVGPLLARWVSGKTSTRPLGDT